MTGVPGPPPLYFTILLEPNYVTYVVPGNDDSIESCAYYLKCFSHAIRAGQKKARGEGESRDVDEPLPKVRQLQGQNTVQGVGREMF